jgi:hypothetical protein
MSSQRRTVPDWPYKRILRILREETVKPYDQKLRRRAEEQIRRTRKPFMKNIDPPYRIGVPDSKATAHQEDQPYHKKLRRRIEDRIRKDKEALYLVARVLNIK